MYAIGVCMERSESKHEPLMFLNLSKLSNDSWLFNVRFLRSSEALQKGCPLACQNGYPLEVSQELIGNLLVSFLKCQRIPKPSEKSSESTGNC